MIYTLQSDTVQGLDLVIHRYQKRLEVDFPDWDIYPRLEKQGDEYRYYTGKRNDFKDINFAERGNTIGFGVESTEDLGNQHQAKMICLVSVKFDSFKRDLQLIESKIRESLRCTFQTTKCTIGDISVRTENPSHPFYFFNVNITANYINYYKLRT